MPGFTGSWVVLMSAFLGTYLITMEDTGRIRLPGTMAELFNDLAVLVYGERPCVEIYPPSSWETLLEEISRGPKPWSEDFEWKVRQKTRSFKEAEIKGKGRLTIPKEHRTYGRLTHTEDLIVIGMIDHIEIWSQERFKDAEEIHRAKQMFGR